ncbi:hypothetical protein [Streptomyces katrae]|uniref:hypothetical protein n=1 Tax=Streptomyces katrae TaxID=68223 RepID=UPI000B2443A9|nr:hypothetical protein [Streptomyces katrae]
MNAKKLSRIAPVALVAAGVILSGPAALAAPRHEASSATSVVDHRSSGKEGPLLQQGSL